MWRQVARPPRTTAAFRRRAHARALAGSRMAVPVAAALAAAQAGSIGIGFSGGGFLIPFFMGVIDMLYRQLGVMEYGNPVAGASSGSIVAFVANGATSFDKMMKEIDYLSEFCASNGNCYGTLQAEVVRVAERLLARDVAKRTNAHGATSLAITYPAPFGAAPAALKLVDDFKDRDDLIAAIASSVYIPLWGGPRLVTKFRGEMVYDGSLQGSSASLLPCPPGVRYCVRVSAYPPGVSVGSFLLNDVLLGGAPSKARLLGVAGGTLLSPALPAHLANAAGAYAAADAASAASEPGQLAQLVKAAAQIVTPGEEGADIFPGRRHKLPFPRDAWVLAMLRPQDAEGRKKMFELGRAEALSWAQEAGFAAAKAYKQRA
ncbi:MAG: hypothetical protein J3K34DRAFT_4270 [Monoraphidium minutum]|nr:MAG: hypothetical protein J3K34DRAFT_4270 [Monoraphidium minutum]